MSLMASSPLLWASSRAASFLRISVPVRVFSSGIKDPKYADSHCVEPSRGTPVFGIDEKINEQTKDLFDKAEIGGSLEGKTSITKKFRLQLPDGKLIVGANLYVSGEGEDSRRMRKRKLVKTFAFEIDPEKGTRVPYEGDVFLSDD